MATAETRAPSQTPSATAPAEAPSATGAAETPSATAPAEALSATGLRAWRRFLVAHSRLTHELDEELRDEHGFSLGDFDVLVQLGEGGRRMCDLAAAIVLSPSGLSRRVDRLERAGYVTRVRAEGDGRSIEARLTPTGRRLLARLRRGHRAGVRERFADHFDERELETLAELLGRLTPED